MTIISIFVALFLYDLFTHWPRLKNDSTDLYDDADGYRIKSSGLVVYTDYGTGVQYLGTVGGGLTPRLKKPTS